VWRLGKGKGGEARGGGGGDGGMTDGLRERGVPATTAVPLCATGRVRG